MKPGKIKEALEEYDDMDGVVVGVETLMENGSIGQQPLHFETSAQLQQYIQKYGDKRAIHEYVGHKQWVRLFFDIDTKKAKIPDPIGYIKTKLFDMGFTQALLYEASAHSSTKTSYHISTNLWMQRGVAHRIAVAINDHALDLCNELRTQDTKLLLDEGVYNNNGRLRLPGCIKLDKNIGIIKRKFTSIYPFEFFVNSICGPDCIEIKSLPYANLDYQIIDFQPEIRQLTAEQQQVLEEWCAEHNAQIVQQTDKIVLETTKPYHCPITGAKHTKISGHSPMVIAKSKLIKLQCWAGQGCETTIETPKTTVEKPRIPKEVHDIVLPHETQCQQYVDFDLCNGITAVRSGLGSGKTKKMLDIFRETQERVICLSTRVAYSGDIQNRMQQQGLDPIHYKKIGEGDSLSPQPNRPLIIQYESLYRLCELTQVDILVLDEWLSILQQIEANLAKGDSSINRLVQLIRTTPKILVLDANLVPGALDILKSLRDNETCVVHHNVFKQKEGYTLEVVPRTEKHASEYYADIKTALTQGENVWSFCSSIKDQQTVIKQLLDEGVLEKEQIGYLNGQDLADNILDGQKHRVMKQNIIQNFDSVVKYRLLMSTATLTSGVDCNLEGFDRGIHLHHRSTSVADFAQAIMRIRQVRAKHHKVYFDMAHSYMPIPAQYQIHADLINDPVANLKAAAKQLVACQNNLGAKWLVWTYQSLGFKIVVRSQNKGTSFKRDDKVQNMYITNPDTETPEILKKFIEGTTHERETMKNRGLVDDIPYQQIQDLFEYTDLQRKLAANNIEYLREDWLTANVKVGIEQLKAMDYIKHLGENPGSVTIRAMSLLFSKEESKLARAINNNMVNNTNIESIKQKTDIVYEFIKVRDQYKLQDPIAKHVQIETQLSREDITKLIKAIQNRSGTAKCNKLRALVGLEQNGKRISVAEVRNPANTKKLWDALMTE